MKRLEDVLLEIGGDCLEDWTLCGSVWSLTSDEDADEPGWEVVVGKGGWAINCEWTAYWQSAEVDSLDQLVAVAKAMRAACDAVHSAMAKTEVRS